MAKKNKRSQVTVVEPVSVRNQCDYQRANGKCGRAMSGNFGKACPGRTCEDWTCEAEGDATAAEPDAVVVYGDSATSGPATYRDRVNGQYAAIETAKDNLLRECVKFGALLTEVCYYLGESRGGNHEGEGLKKWLAANCPEVNYSTAMNYKALAAKCVKMLGGGSQAVAVLQDKTEVIPPGEEEPVEVEAKFVERRDELFGEVKSRRELEQTYFKFMASEGKRSAGRPKGTVSAGTTRAKTAEEKTAEAEEETREILGKVTAFMRGKWLKMVAQQTRDDFVRTLRDCADVAEERMR